MMINWKKAVGITAAAAMLIPMARSEEHTSELQ